MNDKFCMSVIQQDDLYCQDIIDKCSKCAFYEFDRTSNKWVKTGIEGPLYIYKRSMSPFYGFIILGTTSHGNKSQTLPADLTFQLNNPFILYRLNSQPEVYGLWFGNTADFNRIGDKFNEIMSISTQNPPAPSTKPSVVSEVNPSKPSSSSEKLNNALLEAFSRSTISSSTTTTASNRGGDPLWGSPVLNDPHTYTWGPPVKSEPSTTFNGGFVMPAARATLSGLLNESLIKNAANRAVPAVNISTSTTASNSSVAVAPPSGQTNQPTSLGHLLSELSLPPPLQNMASTGAVIQNRGGHNAVQPKPSLYLEDVEKATLADQNDDDILVVPDMLLQTAPRDSWGESTSSLPRPEQKQDHRPITASEDVALTKEQLRKTLIFLLDNDTEFVDVIHAGYSRMMRQAMANANKLHK